MKELSIEEKVKAYDGLIERLKDLKFAYRFTSLSDTIEEMFPELKESEDEQIRKALISILKSDFEKDTTIYDISIGDIIAWLEKQGEQKPTKCHREDEQNLNACLGYIPDEYLRRWLMDVVHVKYDKPADKIEPKFHEGEWVVSPNGVYWHIDRIENNRYEVSSTNGACADWPLDTDLYHLWTIQDAKDGDVLCCESGWTCIFKTLVNDETFSSYCFMDNTKWFCETGCECHTLNKEFMKAYNGEIKPATKEQRDLLFQKMREAGYEWDADRLELKKIESKQEWSEEDKNMLQSILDEYKSMPIEKRNWLKSLKNRYTWKPSDEQFKLLKHIMEHVSLSNRDKSEVGDLYLDLKRL